MILSVLAFSAALLHGPGTAAVTLNRVFSKGEKLQYDVKSNLHVEGREYGLQTFIPSDLDLNYKFTQEVKDLKADGIAVVHYLRPTMTQIDGETFDRPSKTTVEKMDLNFDLTVSPINEILEMKDLNPPKKKKPIKKPATDPDDGGGYNFFMAGRTRQNPLGALMGQFVGELYRLCLNVGSLDSGIDFAPKLPFDEVKEGDTWKKTVGYQPQKLKSKNGKTVVQRLDYTYTYKGIVTVNGKQYYRVNAALDLNTDLANFINDLFDAKPAETHLKSIPLLLKQSIDYNLDMKTKRTVSASATANGGYKVMIIDVPDEAVQEEKMTGTTTLRLIGG